VSTRALTLAIGGAALLGGGLAGCVAGVDVSDEEYDAISQSVGSAQGGSTSSGGSISGGTSGSGATGGSQSSSGGVSGTGNSNGGTGSAQGGTGGAGGSGAGGTGNTPPPAVGDCADATAGSGNFQLKVLYTERAENNQISMVLGLENTGNGFPLSDLVLRYWFSDDDQTVNEFNIDYASNNIQSAISVTFGEALGSNYADVNFSSATDVGQGIEQIQVRLHSQNYAILNQTNDFSYSAGGDEVENRNITAYVNDVKVFGCEPGSGT
jgi:hypothetical protein